MGEMIVKSFDEPDEIVPMSNGSAQVVVLGEVYVGRSTLQPGWAWSKDIRPVVGTESCQHHHQGIVMSGRMEFVTDDGARRIVGPGDAYDVAPRHDARVIGGKPCVQIEFRGIPGWGKPPVAGERVLATLLMTDIVGSTEVAAGMGDESWKELLAQHGSRVQLELDRFRGYEVTTTGDGFLAIFDGTARAVRCAAAICQVAGEDGLQVRAGVHSGEVERDADNIRGVTVHLTSRIAALAGPSEVFVSASTVGLLDGSGLSFDDRGEHQVKGLDGRIRLYSLNDARS